jgi:hypothetical protein
MGFNNPGPVMQNIGNSFIMDEFKMEEIVLFSADTRN